MKICECGICGLETTFYKGKYRRFISGHNGIGTKHKSSTIKIMSEKKLGINNPFYGLKHTEEWKNERSLESKRNEIEDLMNEIINRNKIIFI
ncbi:MAG: NUMOD3 domain-containing DNA-binding protein [archaeon]|nr:NUMOD3 domain-containing DNA-binding protein [archaeon]